MIVKKILKTGNYNTENEDRMKIGLAASVVGLIINIILGAVKVIIGTGTHSVSILSDGVNNITDCTSNIITAAGVYYSRKPADKEHPYGHGRIEYVAALVVSAIVLAVGFIFFKSSLEKVFHPEKIFYTNLQIAIMGLSVLAKLWQGSIYSKVAKAVNFSPLAAASKDSLNDSIVTAFVIVSILVEKLSGHAVDGIGGVIVSIFICYSGYELIRDCVSDLIGKNPPEGFIDELREAVLSYPDVLGVHDIIINTYGPDKIIVVMDVEVPYTMDLITSHNLMERIQYEVGEALDAHIVAHADPVGAAAIKYKDILRHLKVVLALTKGPIEFHDFMVNDNIVHVDVVVDPEKVRTDKEVIEKALEIEEKMREKFPKFQYEIIIDRKV